MPAFSIERRIVSLALSWGNRIDSPHVVQRKCVHALVIEGRAEEFVETFFSVKREVYEDGWSEFS